MSAAVPAVPTLPEANLFMQALQDPLTQEILAEAMPTATKPDEDPILQFQAQIRCVVVQLPHRFVAKKYQQKLAEQFESLVGAKITLFTGFTLDSFPAYHVLHSTGGFELLRKYHALTPLIELEQHLYWLDQAGIKPDRVYSHKGFYTIKPDYSKLVWDPYTLQYWTPKDYYYIK